MCHKVSLHEDVDHHQKVIEKKLKTSRHWGWSRILSFHGTDPKPIEDLIPKPKAIYGMYSKVAVQERWPKFEVRMTTKKRKRKNKKNQVLFSLFTPNYILLCVYSVTHTCFWFCPYDGLTPTHGSQCFN